MATKQEKDAQLAGICPPKHEAKLKTVNLTVSTGKGEAKTSTEFTTEMPESLMDAIAAEGVTGVFRRYLSSLAIERQGEERAKLAPEGEKKERKRAKYLEELGL